MWRYINRIKDKDMHTEQWKKEILIDRHRDRDRDRQRQIETSRQMD